MVLDLRLTKIGCRDDNQFFIYIHPQTNSQASFHSNQPR